MKRVLILLVPALVAATLHTALAAPGAATAQVPQRDARKPATPTADLAPAPTGTGTIAGEVVADATGTKLRLAHVVLIGATTGVLKVTATDAGGRFAFGNLPADRYTVGASKLPYLGAVAGARRPVRPGTPFVLADGATLADITIRLPMGAAVSGTIYDEQGRPAPGVGVGVTKRRMQNGELVFSGMNGATTDDRGMYRIHGLAPGEYLVTAMPPRQVGATARALTDAEVDAALRGTPITGSSPGADAEMAFAPVYFPGTAQADNAQAVLLAPGDDRQNVDLRLERVRLARIEGVLLSADGQTAARVPVMISTAAGLSPTAQSIATMPGPDGHFRTPPVAPGTYTVLARASGPAAGQFAYARIDVGGTDVSGVQLTLQPPLSMAGRVVAKGASAAPSIAGQRMQVRALNVSSTGGGLSPQVSPTSATGEFTVTNLVPGRYVIGSTPFFGASAASVTWGLQSVVVDGADVTDLAVTIAADAMPKDVVITFGDQWQQLSGRLGDAEGKAMTDYTVMVFPVNDAYWLHGTRRIITAQPGSDGRFTLGGPGPAVLPAGEYYLAAVTDVSRDEQYDPVFLQSIISAAIRVTLAPGEKRTQNLAVR
ncbi:MAG: carboxypeptidase-like regulatory domain-containing protein [Acidobacteria bacterium]|nr:carboxypeptidase-like regulatory domain-containing protein [Acidobacteriota bacterium]